MRRLTHPTILVVLVPMLAMAAISTVYLVASIRAVYTRLPETLSAAVSEQVQGRISIDEVDVSAAGIVLRNVVLTASDSDARPIAKAASVKVGYRLSDLVFRRVNPIHGVDRIEVIRPCLFLERGDDGRWNVADLLKPSAVRFETPFRGRVFVRSGTLSVLDRKVPAGCGPVQVNALTKINAVVDLSSNPVADCTITAVGMPGRVRKLSIRARYNLAKRSFNADLDALGASAVYWSKYPRRLGSVEVLSGRVDCRFHVSGGVGEEAVRYSGVLRVHDGVARVAGFSSPVRGLAGEVQLRNGSASLEFRGKLGASPFSLSGRVFDFGRPQMAVRVKSERANLREIGNLAAVDLPRDLALADCCSLDVSISGPARSPSANFSLQVPSLSYRGVQIATLSAHGFYAGRRVVVRRAVGLACGGSVEAEGEVHLGAHKNVILRGRVSDLRLAEIPILKRREVNAATSGDFEVMWAGNGVTGRYRGTLMEGTSHNVEFDEGAVVAEYTNGTLHVRELRAEVMGGKVTASGEVGPDRTLALQVSGADVNVAALGKPYWAKPTVGKLQFAGRLGGTLDKPAFEGQVEADRIMVGGVSVERVEAALNASRDRLRLHELVISNYPGTITVTGLVEEPFTRLPRLDLNLRAKSLDAEKAALSLGLPIRISGDLSAELAVTNTLRDPKAEGAVHVEHGVIADMPFDATDVRVAYGGSKFEITSLAMRSGQAALVASGGIDLDSRSLQVTFHGDGLPLDALTQRLRHYARMVGCVDVAGEINGSIARPVVRTALNCDNLRLNGQPFGKLNARLSWADGRLLVSQATLSDGESEYAVPRLSFSPSQHAVQLEVAVKNGQAQKLLAVLERSPQVSAKSASLREFIDAIPRPLEGSVDFSLAGTVTIADSGVEPNLDFVADLGHLTLGVGHVQSVHVDGEWARKMLRLNKLEVLDGDTNVFAEAVLGPSDRLALKVDAHGLTLQTVARWFKLPGTLSGTADVTIVAGGSRLAPSVEAYLEIVEPTVGNLKFDRLRSRLSSAPSSEGQSPASESRINIDELTLVLGDSDLRASGFLPVDWREFAVPADGKVMLRMALDNASLELLSVFAGNLVEGGAGGMLTGSVALSGTIAAPQLEGGFSWRDGNIQVARLSAPFTGVEAEVGLSGHTILVRRLAGESAEGGSFEVTGTVDLTELKPNLDLTLATREMRVSGKNISGAYEEVVHGVFDSTLQVAGDWRRPQVSGEIGVPKGRLEIVGQPGELRDADGALGFDPSFDVRISLGRDVLLKTERLQAPLYGYLALAGSLSSPTIEGTIDLADGTILFPTRSFRILPGSDMWLRFKPPEPAVVVVDLRARSRMIAVSAFGKRKRYVVTMEAKGPLDRLRPTFEASPPDLSEQRIVALLTGQHQLERILGGDASQDVGSELSGLVSSAVMPSVFEPVEEAVEEALGFEEFALEMGYREPFQLSIGDRLWGDLHLSYTAILGARPDYADSLYELKLSYRFRNSLEIGISTDENSEVGVTAEGKVRF